MDHVYCIMQIRKPLEDTFHYCGDFLLREGVSSPPALLGELLDCFMTQFHFHYDEVVVLLGMWVDLDQVRMAQLAKHLNLAANRKRSLAWFFPI